MTSLQLWPAIDLLGGSAVRLHQGRYDEVTVYEPDPTAVANRWRGLSPRLHVVDLEGAKAGKPVQHAAIASIVEKFGGEVQVGGGIRTKEHAADLISIGVRRIILGSAAISSPALVKDLASKYPHQIVLALDARDGRVAIEGWTETSDQFAWDVAKAFAPDPIAAILFTDIARDGTQIGPNFSSIMQMAQASTCPLLASGGVGTLEHLRRLTEIPNVGGVIVGKALYEGIFTVEQALAALTG